MIALVQKIPVLEIFSKFSPLRTEKSVLTCLVWERGWHSHVVTRIVLDASFNTFPAFICWSDIQTQVLSLWACLRRTQCTLVCTGWLMNNEFTWWRDWGKPQNLIQGSCSPMSWLPLSEYISTQRCSNALCDDSCTLKPVFKVSLGSSRFER
jgi:hypothetical protein